MLKGRLRAAFLLECPFLAPLFAPLSRTPYTVLAKQAKVVGLAVKTR